MHRRPLLVGIAAVSLVAVAGTVILRVADGGDPAYTPIAQVAAGPHERLALPSTPLTSRTAERAELLAQRGLGDYERASLSPDGRVATFVGFETVTTIDIHTGKVIFHVNEDRALEASASNDGKTVVTSIDPPDRRPSDRLIIRRLGQPVAVTQRCRDLEGVYGTAISEDGVYASAWNGQVACLWRLEDGKLVERRDPERLAVGFKRGYLVTASRRLVAADPAVALDAAYDSDGRGQVWADTSGRTLLVRRNASRVVMRTGNALPQVSLGSKEIIDADIADDGSLIAARAGAVLYLAAQDTKPTTLSSRGADAIDVTIAPDGRTAAILRPPAALEIVELPSGKARVRTTIPAEQILDAKPHVQLGPGNHVFTASTDNSAAVGRVEGPAVISVRERGFFARVLSVTPSMALLDTPSGAVALPIDGRSERPLPVLDQFTFELDVDEKTVAFGSDREDDGSIGGTRIRANLESGALAVEKPRPPAEPEPPARPGVTVASIGDATVTFARNGEKIVAPAPFAPTDIDLSENGDLALLRRREAPGVIVRTSDGTTVSQLSGAPLSSNVGNVAFSDDGAKILIEDEVAGNAAKLSTPLRFWEVASGREISSTFVSGAGFTALAFSPDGSRAVGAWFETTENGGAHYISIWRTAEPAGLTLERVRAAQVSTVGVTDDGTRVLVSDGPQLYVLDPRTEDEPEAFGPPLFDAPTRLRLTGTGSTLSVKVTYTTGVTQTVSSSAAPAAVRLDLDNARVRWRSKDKSLEVVDGRDQYLVRRVTASASVVFGPFEGKISRDPIDVGGHLVFGTDDHVVAHDRSTGERRWRTALREPEIVTDRTGEHVIAANGATLLTLHTKTGRTLGRLELGAADGTALSAIATTRMSLAADDDFLAVSQGGRVRLIDLSTIAAPVQRRNIEMPFDYLNALQFNPAGTLLAVLSNRGAVMLIGVPADSPPTTSSG